MREPEQTVDELVSALCQAGQVLNEHRAALLRTDGWSSVTSRLELSEWHARDGRRLEVYCDLDGERAGVGHVGWIVDVLRDGEGWLVERRLNLNRQPSEVETIAELPRQTCRDSTELARTLVPLVRELLAVAAPEP